MSKKQSVMIISDVQWPYHDRVVMDKLIEVARKYQPDRIVQIGDLIDMPTVSRWAKGDALEYAGTLQQHIDGVRTGFLSPLREAAPAARIQWIAGNHDERTADYVKKYAPALAPLRALSMESLFDLDTYAVEYVKGPIRIATNTYGLHGHECGGYAASASAWDTKFQKRYGTQFSYVWGHTHSPAIIHRAYGFGGDLSPRFSMNVGSIMDPSKVTYVKDQSMSWVQSFGWIEDDGKRTHPELVTLVDRLGYFKGERL